MRGYLSMSKSINPEQVADIIKDVAATIIMPRFQNLSDDEIKSKTGPTDLVTIADLESEEALTKHFKDILPGSYVVGEEAVSKNEISTSILATENDPVWVIDPVDGTNNFATGNPTFGVIVTLVQGGQTVQGWIYDVPGDRTAITERGSGVEINGARKIYPANDKPLKESKGFISRKFLPKQMRDELKETLENEFGCILKCNVNSKCVLPGILKKTDGTEQCYLLGNITDTTLKFPDIDTFTILTQIKGNYS